MKRVVMFSGGAGSWATARRVADKYGVDDLTLLFADTSMEDEDLYRFIDEAAADIGVPVTRLVEGRTPWEVFFDRRFLGNSRVDPCSLILKRQQCDAWLSEHCDPADTICYVGIDWSERHRFDRLAARHAATDKWVYAAPLCDPPYLTKKQILQQLADVGIAPPRLYAMGFAHNNCGGFCIKAGMGHFATLLRAMPERYAYHEQKEQELREFLGKDVAVMTDRRGKMKKPMTMRQLRERIEAGEKIDRHEVGGCGCFSDVDDAPVEEVE